MTDEQLEIQKRLTLNWLIQGAAQHAGMTFHYLVKDELNALDPGLLPYYDQYALMNLLQYWLPGVEFISTRPDQFWRQTVSDPQNPFYAHPLLSRYGGLLADSGRRRASARCQEKGFNCLAVAMYHQAFHVVMGLRRLEAPHCGRLQQLARETASMVWGIPLERLHGDLETRIMLFENMLPARNAEGAAFRACIVGYGGVARRGDELIVTATGTNWLLLAKELVKGTAELICLHGLNQLDDDMYRRVIDTTDHLDLEPWMLQSGGELWRRLLASFPDDVPLANVLMQLARLPAGTLESTLSDVIEKPEGTARLAL
ncbi:MAG TPA: hypothetical protein VMF08_03195 [Candidatus Sulfotelmatobacter sp.]|nr:hypothetical protein [Candidatus Sulfotelmatobacter sp.]